MTTDADIGFGVLFKIRTSTDPDVYTTIGQQKDVTPPGVKIDAIDATHNESQDLFREFIPGLIDAGEISFQIHYKPDSTAMSALAGYIRQAVTCRSVWPSGAYIQYTAFLTEIAPEAPTDDKMVATVTFKITGKWIVNAASAPVNTILPAISGTLGEGDVLTLYEGVWDNEPTSFTYQWKKAGSDINGATDKTYVIQAGDAGSELSVTVTAINSAGSSSATSAPITADAGS